MADHSADTVAPCENAVAAEPVVYVDHTVMFHLPPSYQFVVPRRGVRGYVAVDWVTVHTSDNQLQVSAGGFVCKRDGTLGKGWGRTGVSVDLPEGSVDFWVAQAERHLAGVDGPYERGYQDALNEAKRLVACAPVTSDPELIADTVRLRYYLDTEFIEDGQTIELISIGIICDDGRDYYAEVEEVPWEKADQWVLDNVKPHLFGRETVRSREDIANEIVRFVSQGKGQPEFWGYYADYDWVVLCRLYGRMIDLPSGWPMFCMDLKQLAEEHGNPKLPKQESVEHNALADARWNRDAHRWLLAHIDGSEV